MAGEGAQADGEGAQAASESGRVASESGRTVSESGPPSAERAPGAADRALLWATALVPALLVWPEAGTSFGAHAALKFAALAPLAACWAWSARHETRRRGAESALAAALLAAGASALVTRQPLAGAAPLLVRAACLWLVARGVRSRFGGRPDEVERAIAFGALAVASVTLGEMLGLDLPWAATQRPQGTLANRNYVAGFLAIGLPACASVALRAPALGLAAAGLSATVAVATRCRSGYLALLTALALTLALAALRARREGASGLARALAGRPEARRRLSALAGALALGAALGALAPWPGVRFNQSAAQAAGRLFEHDRGSGRARLDQHLVGLEALREAPSRWLLGAGPGTWEDAASRHAHATPGRHVPMTLGPNSPNSDALRVLVEQGLVGLACLAAAFALTLRAAASRALGRGPFAPAIAVAAGLVAALVHGLFDAPLFRAECVALLGLLVGAAPGGDTEGAPARRPLARLDPASGAAPLARFAPASAATSLARFAPTLVAAPLAALAFCRAASFAVAGSGPASGGPREQRQELAAKLAPRAEIFEQLALARARGGRCDEAEAALARLNELRPHHWGARVEVSSCFTKAGRRHDARRVWGEAQRVEAHLEEVVGALKTARLARSHTSPP
ncbi:MAG TPA: O-antigen ligase family protein [Polyangiaceae bacterium]|nr:O-antigen ligase family protein [Polyangiaceae bacterium]